MTGLDYCLLGGINTFSTIDADGISIVLFFQGCPFNCPGCHNPEMQPMVGGQRVWYDEILALIEKGREWYKAVVFSGGEPTEQSGSLIYLMGKVKEMGLERWLYTGREYKDIPEEIKELASVIVAGRYEEDKATGGFPASSNQTVIDLRE